MTCKRVHLTPTLEDRARWETCSRADGKPLAKWIIETVRNAVNARTIQDYTLPEGISFLDLKPSYDHDKYQLTIDATPILRICEASGVDPATILRDKARLDAFMRDWYADHLKLGGAVEPAYEQACAVAEFERIVQERSHGITGRA